MTVETNRSAVASAEQREQFERDGYLVIDDVAPAQTLDRIVAGLEGRFGNPHQEGGVRYFRNRIQDAWKIDEHVKALALSAPALALLADLYGRKPLPFQTLNFLKGTQQAAHADAMH